MGENAIREKSKLFAIRVIRLYQFLTDKKREFTISKQLLRAGTSIGANVREATQAFSKNDFTYKMSIALKECDETCYWLEILQETGYVSPAQYENIYNDAQELFKMLTAIVKTAKSDS